MEELAVREGEFVAVPEASTYKLDDHIPLEEGTFVEPFACAVHVCRLLQLSPTDRKSCKNLIERKIT